MSNNHKQCNDVIGFMKITEYWETFDDYYYSTTNKMLKVCKKATEVKVERRQNEVWDTDIVVTCHMAR